MSESTPTVPDQPHGWPDAVPSSMHPEAVRERTRESILEDLADGDWDASDWGDSWEVTFVVLKPGE
jgi:hypothetical protein